jgi:ubiquinone/menaquinone biosynthesis C-methylase UbiE
MFHQDKCGFGEIDKTDDPGNFIRFLDVRNATAHRVSSRAVTFELLAAKVGDRVLDLGCGPGDAARELARVVGDSGRIVGVDLSEAMITEARRRNESPKLPTEFQVGDACRLGFPDGTFDGCRASSLLQHVPDPRLALSEMVRVARYGARVVVYEPDHESMLIDATDIPLTRRIVAARSSAFRQGLIGRRLYSLFVQAGLVDIRVVPRTNVFTNLPFFDEGTFLIESVAIAQRSGIVSAAEARSWIEDLEKRNRDGCFFAAMTTFTVVGTKPSPLQRA